nr:MAG TPA: hypothetical protein [Caudoviricetes sp.]
MHILHKRACLCCMRSHDRLRIFCVKARQF